MVSGSQLGAKIISQCTYFATRVNVCNYTIYTCTLNIAVRTYTYPLREQLAESQAAKDGATGTFDRDGDIVALFPQKPLPAHAIVHVTEVHEVEERGTERRGARVGEVEVDDEPKILEANGQILLLLVRPAIELAARYL